MRRAPLVFSRRLASWTRAIWLLPTVLRVRRINNAGLSFDVRSFDIVIRALFISRSTVQWPQKKKLSPNVSWMQTGGCSFAELSLEFTSELSKNFNSFYPPAKTNQTFFYALLRETCMHCRSLTAFCTYDVRKVHNCGSVCTSFIRNVQLPCSAVNYCCMVCSNGTKMYEGIEVHMCQEVLTTVFLNSVLRCSS